MIYPDNYKLGIATILRPIDNRTLEDIYKKAPHKKNNVVPFARNTRQRQGLVKALVSNTKSGNMSYLVELIKKGRLDHFYLQFSSFEEVAGQDYSYFLNEVEKGSGVAGTWLLDRLKTENIRDIDSVFDPNLFKTENWIEKWQDINWEPSPTVTGERSLPSEREDVSEVSEVRRLQRANEKLKAKLNQQSENDKSNREKASIKAQQELSSLKQELDESYQTRLDAQSEHHREELQRIKEKYEQQLNSAVHSSTNNGADLQNNLNKLTNELEEEKEQCDQLKQDVQLGREEVARMKGYQFILEQALRSIVSSHAELKIAFAASRPDNYDGDNFFLGSGGTVDEMARLVKVLELEKLYLIQEEINSQYRYELRLKLKEFGSECQTKIVSKSQLQQ